MSIHDLERKVRSLEMDLLGKVDLYKFDNLKHNLEDRILRLENRCANIEYQLEQIENRVHYLEPSED